MKDNTANNKGEQKRNLFVFFDFIAEALLAAAIIYFCEAEVFFQTLENSNSISLYFVYFVILVLVIYFASLFQIIIHELGHLVFGLISGYKFNSFRILSFMFIKQDGKIKFKRYSLAGTGGQCLMSPPNLIDGKIPVFLYNLGGAIMNIIASGIFLLIYVLIPLPTVVTLFVFVLTAMGAFFAFSNGIPMHTKQVDNDGYNAFSLAKDKEALYSFWLQFKINDEISKGVRLKDMPEEWFAVPDDGKIKNSIIAVQSVFACNRLMDENKFVEADELMEHLLEIDSAIVELHRNLIICDRIYCELIGENRRDKTDALLDKKMKKFMVAMKNFPSVIRTNYAYALLADRNKEKAEKICLKFDKTAKKYPYKEEITAERELMDLALEKYNYVKT